MQPAHATDQHAHLGRDFLICWLPAQAIGQRLFDGAQLAHFFVDVYGQANGATLIRQGAGNGLANPPGGIGAEAIPTLIIEGCLYNLNEIPYLDFDKPWWTQNLAETTAFGDKLFLVSGDISMGMIRYIHCLYFNQTVTDSYGIDELYDEVFDGSWTITRMNELCTGMYDDLNGNDSVDLNSDRFGYIITNENLWRAYIDSLDVNYLYISPKTGLPEFNFADPRSFEVCDFFAELLSAGLIDE